MTPDATPSIVRINPPELGTPPGYSQIVDVSAGRIIFISGQTALDRDGHVVGKHDFAAQATQCLPTSRRRCRQAVAPPPTW